MIQIICGNNTESKKKIDQILNRSQLDFGQVNDSVEEIVQRVQKIGDLAISQYTKKFDGVNLRSFEVAPEEIEAGYNQCDSKLIEALTEAKENIWNYHSKQLQKTWIDLREDGTTLGQIVRPIEKVGVYVPGGTAPLPSTVLMNVIPAKVAGVDEVIMMTPPSKDGTVNKAILAAAKIAGVDRVFKVGGAQAIAAMAFGTETIPKVYKITGPGNIYVAIAKRLVYGYVDIDMIAGPSEILIIADEKADPRYVAADLLSQAEHDNLASSILITTSQDLGEKVKKEIIKQTQTLSRKDIIVESLKEYGAIIIVDTLEEAVALSNQIAPEHLELMVEKPFELLNSIKNAGAIFLGSYSPEPLGDYFAGPNHTLPTSGTAKFYSPLSVDDYIKKSSLIYYNKEALLKNKDQIITIAEEEGLTAHANAIKVRCDQ